MNDCAGIFPNQSMECSQKETEKRLGMLTKVNGRAAGVPCQTKFSEGKLKISQRFLLFLFDRNLNG
jgi:hypothetical protein